MTGKDIIMATYEVTHPVNTKEKPLNPFKIKKKYIPPKDHHWRKYPVLQKQDISELALQKGMMMLCSQSSYFDSTKLITINLR